MHREHIIIGWTHVSKWHVSITDLFQVTAVQLQCETEVCHIALIVKFSPCVSKAKKKKKCIYLP